MSVPASHCEAKKHSYRQTQDGIVVSFVLHPNDVPADLTLAPLGTRYMLALAQIGDDEKPVEPVKGQKSPSQRAFLLGRKTDFQLWVGQQTGELGQTEETCAQFIKTRCGIFSRSRLDTDQNAKLKFEMIESQYEADTGRAAAPR